jgi:RNA polymerase-binding transcription factor DksA
MHHEEHKARLEAELTELVAQLNTIAVQDQETTDWEAKPVAEELGNADENLEADVFEDWAMRRALVAELETRYRNITRALGKIADGTYGICELSGEPIEPERLAANPAARTNIANRDREQELPL